MRIFGRVYEELVAICSSMVFYGIVFCKNNFFNNKKVESKMANFRRVPHAVVGCGKFAPCFGCQGTTLVV